MRGEIQDGVDRLRRKWPQSHAVPGDHGYNLITVPSVLLPKGYKETICTVLFVCHPGFPSVPPQDFFTDIEIHLADGWSSPVWTFAPTPKIKGNFPTELWPQWSQCMWWNWKLQSWSTRCDLLTYMHVILNRLRLAQ